MVWATSVIFTKTPKENSHPTSENSPYLVTLVALQDCAVLNAQL
jgi:hypothetical protein